MFNKLLGWHRNNEYPKFIDEILEKLRNVNSNFFTADIAKRYDGEWIIMELGDG